jgi:hypothetical protein
MPSHAADPRDRVVAPVHRALELLVLRGAASFAVAVTAVLVGVLELDGRASLVGQAALPVVLLFVNVARAAHVVIDRRPWDGHAAWSRAAAIDRGETWTAAFVAVVVPIAWAVGGASLLVRHASSPADAAAVLGIWLPLGLGLWLGATIAWAGDCRERLARALEASEQEFRAYWARPGRSA